MPEEIGFVGGGRTFPANWCLNARLIAILIFGIDLIKFHLRYLIRTPWGSLISGALRFLRPDFCDLRFDSAIVHARQP
jgi:hypothetical protein